MSFLIIGTSFALCLASPEEQLQPSHLSLNESSVSAVYDDFDTLADDMVDMGVVPEKPEEISLMQYWIQKLCSPIIMKYVLVKGYLRNWCYMLVGVKKISSIK